MVFERIIMVAKKLTITNLFLLAITELSYS